MKYKNITKKGVIKVVDTVAPMVEVTDLVIGVDEELDLNNFISKCEDYSMPCNVQYKDSKDEEKSKKQANILLILLLVIRLLIR